MISFILLYFVVWFLRLIGYLLEIVVWFYNYLIDCILYLLTQILVWEWTYFGSPISNIPLLVVNFVMEFTQSIFNFLTYPPVILLGLLILYVVVYLLQQSAQPPKENAIEKIVKVQNDEQNLCVICLSEQKCMLIRPCNHVCLCLECSNLMKDKSKESECPLCRVRIKLFERVYM